MKFLVDQNLPPVLADWLIARGHEASHIFHLNRAEDTDQTLSRLARQLNAVIVSKDWDLAAEAGGDNIANWLQVLWVRTGNATNPDLFTAFETGWPAAIAALETGEPLVEIG